MATSTVQTKAPVQRLVLTRPDDWHVHLRDGDFLRDTVPASARQFGRVIAMPNLKPPVVTTEQALAYRERILAHVASGPGAFEPLMTLYLTDRTTPADIVRAARSDHVVAAKLYPAGATTNSDSGVTDLNALGDTLKAMRDEGLLLLIHGEVTDPSVDIFDREQRFIEQVLGPLVIRFEGLKIVFEHITTSAAVDYVMSVPSHVAATITAHHLHFTRNDMLVGGIKPHRYCLPILKSFEDRDALVRAATSGDPRFFLGTDSAPHAWHAKESACGCAGTYTAHAAIELYAEAFEAAGALNKLEAFASHHGPDFYGLPRNQDTICLERRAWTVPPRLRFGDTEVVPMRGGEAVAWRLVSDD